MCVCRSRTLCHNYQRVIKQETQMVVAAPKQGVIPVKQVATQRVQRLCSC